MRKDNKLFETDNKLGSKEARYVVSIDFDGTVQYFTSHDDIANVPGTPIQSVLIGISATSQTLNPDRANATIGSMSFDILDLNEAFTDLVRTELATNDVGLRGRTCTFHIGYKTDQDGAGVIAPGSTDDNPDFDNFALFQTQIVQSVESKEGRYSIKCADIQRETKKQIFELALTYLTNSISDSTTTIPVLDLSGFEGNNHGTSYTDAPSSNVIYIEIDQTKEIIRCPVADIVGNSFTNVTRGALQTKAKAVEVDQTQASDRRPKVEEYVYLELPAVKLAYAILTGVIEGTGDVLPSSWHAGVPTAFVRLSDFQNIGADLWVTGDDTAGVILRFDGIDKQDAKRFLETEIYLLLGLFSPVYADGQLGLKRMVPSLSDSPFSFEVNENNVIGTSTLKHDMESMQNNLRIDWNWNGDRYIRSTIVVDSGSIARHGQAPEKRLSFRGLVGTRFTEQVLRQLLTSLRDMYTGPPLRLDVDGFHLLNAVEVGDACRVNLPHIRDYSQSGSNLNRTMVVHGMTVDWLAGVKLKLFGSSERADEIPPIVSAQCLLDAFYPQEGTALSSIPGLMTGNVTNAGTFTLSGSGDMNAAASIFYHDAPLTISSTTTLIIEDNVQLRARGFLTIDGLIDGTAKGLLSGVSLFDFDQHYYWLADKNVGVPGFIGNSQSHLGLLYREPDDGGFPNWVWVTAGYFTEGLHQAFPNLILEVSDAGSGSIIGIPADMRGGGGSFGARAGLKIGLFGRTHQKAAGGAGGRGGGALCIVCRGGDFGVSGQITLDGDDSVSPSTFFNSAAIYDIYGGAGGAGAPGALLWLIDGSAQTFPDLAGHFQAKTGIVPAAFALPFIDGSSQNRSLSQTNAPANVQAPFMPGRISDFDQSGVNFRISFLPCDVTPEDDQDTQVVAPTGLTATAIQDGVRLDWSNPPQELFDHIEIHASDEDVRSTAIIIGTTEAETFIETIVARYRNRYYWIRAVSTDLFEFSLFEPDTSTTLAIATANIVSDSLLIDPDFDLSTALSAPGEPVLDNFWFQQIILTDAGIGTEGTAITLEVGAGRNGSNTVLMKHGNEPNNPTVRKQLFFLNTRRFRSNIPDFTVKIIWRNNSPNPYLSLNIGIVGYAAATGGVALTSDGIQSDFATTGATWQELTFHVAPAAVPDGAQFWELKFQSDDTANIDHFEFEIDSVFVYGTDAEFGKNTVAGKTQQGLVPEADQATEASLFLQGDGTWGTPTGSGVDSFNSRIGAVLPILADYDSFFLTPAEGDAAYSMLGHSHVPADITFAATNRLLGRDTGGGGAGEELTAAAVRTILNVEDGSTADQTSIVGITGTAAQFDAALTAANFAFAGGAFHDGFSDFLAAEHVDWAATGAENLHANRFGGGANFADTDLNRPVIEDYAVKHQTLTITSNAITLDFTFGNSALVDLQAATSVVTLTLLNPPASGRRGEASLIVVQGTTPRQIIFPATVTFLFGDVTPTIGSIADSVHEIHFWTFDGGATYFASYAPADGFTVPSQLSDLSDVNTSTPTNRHALFADGIDFESRRAVAADISFAATDRFLGRDTAGAGDGEEITAAAARTILGVEAGSTADQTAAEIEGIVNHDNLLGFVAQEHIRWDLTGAEDIHADRFANAPVASVFDRTGVVVAVQADYDSFFLTPAEGDAAYSMLGHLHNAADINAGILAVLRGGTGVAASTGSGNNVLSASPTFTGTMIAAAINMADSLLDRPHISDFAIEHQVIAGTASTTINYSLGQSVLLNLSSFNITMLTITNWPASGRLGQLEIEITQGATPRTIAWDTAISGTVGWPEGAEPDLSVANGRMLVSLRSRDGKTTLLGTFAEDVK